MTDVNTEQADQLEGARKTLKAITLETGDAQTGFYQSHCPACAEVSPTHNVMTEFMREHLARLPASAWVNQHSSRDAVTEWICLGLSMDEDVAGLTDDKNLSPTEEMDETADDTIKDEWPGPGCSRRHEDESRVSPGREDTLGRQGVRPSCCQQRRGS